MLRQEIESSIAVIRDARAATRAGHACADATARPVTTPGRRRRPVRSEDANRGDGGRGRRPQPSGTRPTGGGALASRAVPGDPSGVGPHELFAVDTADGVRLSAGRYGDPTADVALVFGHGFTGHQLNPRVTHLARRLAANGLAVYTFDFRGHGKSGGRSTFGDREVVDLEALVQQVRGRHSTIVSSGASMGAFVALRHAGMGGQVDAVVAVSSPAFAEPSPLWRARILGRLVRSDRGRRLLHLYGTRTEPFAPVTSAPVHLAARIAPVPVVLVHGTNDPYVPLSDAFALYEELRDPRSLVVLPRFGHAEAGFGDAFVSAFEAVVREVLDAAPTAPPQRRFVHLVDR